jgi:hypothetical protein
VVSVTWCATLGATVGSTTIAAYATPADSEQSLRTTAAVAIDESPARFQASSHTRSALLLQAVKHGVEIPIFPTDYNCFFDGVDQHDALRVYLQAEDELC